MKSPFLVIIPFCMLAFLPLLEDDVRQTRMKIRADSEELFIGERFSCSFQRTLRIPDDGKDYPLPPGLGQFPIYRVKDYADRVPSSWKKDGYFIPMYQREAMWIRFHGADWKPNAVKIAVGEVNVLDGNAWDVKLTGEPQNYMVIPTQPWLDGIKSGDGYIRQFVAMPLGSGYTVEKQITGKETVGGLQIAVFEPKAGRFPDSRPYAYRDYRGIYGEGIYSMTSPSKHSLSAQPKEMGLAAGGRMTQKIYPDPHGLNTWDESFRGETVVYIVNSESFKAITGKEAPESPITAAAYTSYGYPWFALYDEREADLKPTDKMKRVKGMAEIDKKKRNKPDPADSSLTVPDEQIIKLKKKP